MSEAKYAKGLEGVIAAETEICRIDGEKGKLYYYGYSIDELAAHCNYEEVTYLLLYGELPTIEQYGSFSQRMRAARDLKKPVVEMIRTFPRADHPMELLQSVISFLSGYVDHKIEHSAYCNCRDTLHQIAQLPTVIAAHKRLQEGKEFVPPNKELSHGANFLSMLRGEEPSTDEGDMMDTMLILHAEHGFNASTFTARVVASTLSTCYCSISAAMGALFGSLHGGANERVLDMVEEIGTEDNVVPWLEKALEEKRKVMGMGHRVYRAKDPRSYITEEFLKKLIEKYPDNNYYEVLKKLESEFKSKMEEKGKPIYPNVDFFSGTVYEMLGIPKLYFTPIFAMARAAGWLAHILEQRRDNRIYRPRGLYVGTEERRFVSIEKR